MYNKTIYFFLVTHSKYFHSLIIIAPPELSPFSNSETIGILNNSISLQFIITRDHPTVELSNILWFFNGEQLNTTGERYYFSDNKLVLYISALQFEDEGEYTVIVSNDAGIGEASINLDVQGIFIYDTNVFACVLQFIMNIIFTHY